MNNDITKYCYQFYFYTIEKADTLPIKLVHRHPNNQLVLVDHHGPPYTALHDKYAAKP